MKRIILAALCSLSILSLAVAEDVLPLALSAKDARTMGMGGAFTALSTGYQAFFGNPAGFSSKRGSFSLAVSSWAYVNPSSDNITDALALVNGESDDALGLASNLLTDRGLGAGAAFGIGVAGKRLALGMNLITDQYAQGDTLLGTKIRSATQGNIVIGYALPLGTERFNLTVGADLRPFFRIDADVAANDLIAVLQSENPDLMATLGELPGRMGFGLAADLGAKLNLGPLAVGLSIRDIAPPFEFSENSLATIFEALGSGGAPEPSDTPDTAQFLPDLTLGISYKPRLLPGLIDPALYFEIKDPIRAYKEEASFWNLLHAGAELRLLSFVYLRGGLNKGWISAGAGLDLLIFELDAAIFTEELGRRPGDKPRTGLTVNAAFRL